MEVNVRRIAWLLVVAGLAPFGPPWGNGAAATGDRIIYVVPHARSGTIYAVHPDGTNEERLGRGTDPVPSPSGALILYTQPIDNRSELWIMNADGSDKHRIARYGHYEDSRETWSPDDDLVAFSRQGDNSGIFVSTSEGKKSKVVGSTHNVGSPVFSPDGSMLAYEDWVPCRESAICSGRTYDIFTVTLGGSNRTNLTTSPRYEEQPEWSPDGARIAFSCMERGEGAEGICIMSEDGSDFHATASPGAENESRIAWLDAFRILGLTSYIEGSADHTWIHADDAEGSSFSNLTSPRSVAHDPWPSPDGTQVVFTWVRPSRDRPAGIYTMNADGTAKRLLVEGSSGQPRWSN